VDYLDNRTVIVWSKDGVPPALPLNAPQIPPHWHGLMWGIFPLGSSLLAILVLLIPGSKPFESRADEPQVADEQLVHRRLVS
jgi:hypothetical protein